MEVLICELLLVCFLFSFHLVLDIAFLHCRIVESVLFSFSVILLGGCHYIIYWGFGQKYFWKFGVVRYPIV